MAFSIIALINSKDKDFKQDTLWSKLTKDPALDNLKRASSDWRAYKNCSKKLFITTLVLSTVFILVGILLATVGPKLIPHVNGTLIRSGGGLLTAASFVLGLVIVVLLAEKNEKLKKSIASQNTNFKKKLKEELKQFAQTHKEKIPTDTYIGCWIEESEKYFYSTDGSFEQVCTSTSQNPLSSMKYLDATDFVSKHG